MLFSKKPLQKIIQPNFLLPNFFSHKLFFSQKNTKKKPFFFTKKLFSPENFLFTKKKHLHTKIRQPLHKENEATSSHKKNTESLNQKITQPLHEKKNHTTSRKNTKRITKRCPENITLVLKCVKLLFPKLLRKFLKKI